jgi:hypothetical protein
MRIIDCDQHLYESRTTWADHMDPASRDDALAIVDDELGYPWLQWRGRRLQLADVQQPGDTAALGRWRERQRAGEPPAYRYDEVLPEDYWAPRARVERLAGMGVGEAVLFPNFGLLWERSLSGDLPALTANMGPGTGGAPQWCPTAAGTSTPWPTSRCATRTGSSGSCTSSMRPACAWP